MAFILSADQLKQVQRKNRLHDGSRNENSAEHSCHLSLMALLLADQAEPGTDIAHVVELLITHDLVEIHAGDHWVTDGNRAEIAAREAVAAGQIFNPLPDD